jgi:hypothetical protein
MESVGKLGELEKGQEKCPFLWFRRVGWRILDENKAARDVERAIADTLRLPF